MADAATSPSILAEAEGLTRGPRNDDYGQPFDDFDRTAKIWSAILGIDVTAEQVAMCMIGVKLSRECHRPKRDNRVDMAGYSDCLDRVVEERARRRQSQIARIGDSEDEIGSVTVSQVKQAITDSRDSHRSFVERLDNLKAEAKASFECVSRFSADAGTSASPDDSKTGETATPR